MSCQGTWADAIIIQAVDNCFNLSIYIAESNDTFAPVTVVQPVNMTRGCTNIYIWHIAETHYVSAIEKISSLQLLNNRKFGKTLVEEKLIDAKEKRRVYMRAYMKKKRADAEFRKRENENFVQTYMKLLGRKRSKLSQTVK